jgi:hypothetical protein
MSSSTSAISRHAGPVSEPRVDAQRGSDEDFEHCELLLGQRDVAAVAVEGGVVSAEELLARAWDENADPFIAKG